MPVVAKYKENPIGDNAAELLAVVLWGAQAALWEWDLTSEAITRSAQWFELTGYARAQWDGEDDAWFSRMHPHDVLGVRRQLDDCLAGRSEDLEICYRLRCANGALKWLKDRGRTTARDVNGKPERISGVTLDIDQHRRAELSLRLTEQRLDTAIGGADFGLLDLDCVSGVARWLNDWCDRYDIEPCAGDSHLARWNARIHADDRAPVAALFDALWRSRSPDYLCHYRILTRSGAWRWIDERGRVVERNAQGLPLRVVGICVDSDARHSPRSQAAETVPLAHSHDDVAGQDLIGISLILRALANDTRTRDAEISRRLEEVIAMLSDRIAAARVIDRG